MVEKKKKSSKPKAAGSKHPPAPSSSSLVDEQLARYREMRDFSKTAEPSGQAKVAASAKTGDLPFVIQKHAATRLHYDFRLGLHGVLKSWAVTKGPSYVPGDKRLAVQVEDHPMEYGGFEGTIPKGQYGGGTVMLWDEGTWEPLGNPDESLAKGNLKFILHGQKLQGKWVLVRMGGKAASEAKPNWLLIKEHDEYEQGAGDEPITEKEPNSVLTQRDMEAICPGWGPCVAIEPAGKLRQSIPGKAGAFRGLCAGQAARRQGSSAGVYSSTIGLGSSNSPGGRAMGA